MDLLINKFKEALDMLREPTTHHHAGDKDLIYLTFEPEEIPKVKQIVPALKKLATHQGYKIEVLSLAEVLDNFFSANPNRESWFTFDNAQEKWELEDLFKDLGDIVKNNDVIGKALLEKQAQINGAPKTVLLITDLEILHPFSRFGPIEQKIYNEIQMPMMILYPGKKSGSALNFLGFYPEDGNYRSKHI
jgi:hypothetical protein